MAEASRCRVCGQDNVRAHNYGALTCWGCKQFFSRKSKGTWIPPCPKEQKCRISIYTRKGCKFCRFKKCVEVGMSTATVRNVPHEEKSQAHFFVERMSERTLWYSVEKAHEDTHRLTKKLVATVILKAQAQPPDPDNRYSSQVFCPLNEAPHLKRRDLRYYNSSYGSVTEFSKRIPGFLLLPREDQYTLLSHGFFKVLLMRLAGLFDSQNNRLHCLNGQIICRDIIQEGRRAKFLELLFLTAEKINNLNLADRVLGFFCSVVMVNDEIPELRDMDAVRLLRKKLSIILKKSLLENHPDNPNILRNLQDINSSLTSLNSEHISDVGSEITHLNCPQAAEG